MSDTRDLAERIADSLLRNELEQEESLEPSETAAIIRAELAESPELREVREAITMLLDEYLCAWVDEGGEIRAFEQTCGVVEARSAIAALNRITGKLP